MDIDAVIAERGWALQAVLPDGPGVPCFTYTIGLFDRSPELLCVGPSHAFGGATLNALARHLRAHPELAHPGRRIELPTGDGAFPVVELGAVAPCWHDLYVGQAIAYHRRDDLEVLQVLAPDDDGRFPNDPRVARWSLTAQPVLADPELPWRLPHGLTLLEVLGEQGEPPSHAVLLPILDGGVPIGREEVVPAHRVGDHWQLTHQPALADWCAADDLVAATPVDGATVGIEGAEVHRFERVVRPAGRTVLRWGSADLCDHDFAKLERILRRPTFRDQVTIGLGASPHALSLAVPTHLATQLRRDLRRFERDGRLVPRRLFHEPEDADLAAPHADCPHCQARW